MEFINKSELVFSDLSDEKYREYDFGDHIIRINNPLKLNVSESNGHRVFDRQGISHYIPFEWYELRWEIKEGCSHFAF